MALRQRAVGTLPTLMRALSKERSSPPNHPLPSFRRVFSLYDQINLIVIDNFSDDLLRFQQFTDTGFRINGVKHSLCWELAYVLESQ